MFQNKLFESLQIRPSNTFFVALNVFLCICLYSLTKCNCLFCITSGPGVCLAPFLLFTFISIVMFVFLSTCQFFRESAFLSVNTEAYLPFFMLVNLQIVWLSSWVGKLYHRYCWHRWCTLSSKYLPEFSERIIREPEEDVSWKTRGQKSHAAVPLIIVQDIVQ